MSTGELGVLLFADDMVLMFDTAEGFERNWKVMSQVLSRWEEKVNKTRQKNGKTKRTMSRESSR